MMNSKGLTKATLNYKPIDVIIRFWKRILLAFTLILISNILLVINPLIFRQALLALGSSEEAAREHVSSIFNVLFHSHLHSIYLWGVVLLTLAILSALLKYGMRLLFLGISREVEKELRDKVFDRMQSQSRAFFDRHGVGDLLSRLTNDITVYRDMLGPGLIYPAFFVSLVVPALGAMYYLSPVMAEISIIPFVGMYLLNLAMRHPMMRVSYELQGSLSDMSRMAHEHYSGIRMIKGYGIEKQAQSRFNKLCENFGIINRRYLSFQGMILIFITIMIKLITIVLVVTAGAIILLAWDTLSPADFLSFMWIQSYLLGPLLMLGWVMPMYHKGLGAYERLEELYQEPIEVYEEVGSIPQIPAQADIVFRDLTFTYPSQHQPALKNLNLEIKGGSFIGITGPVGSGKTTLFRLLTREYEVPSNKIFIAGRDIHEYSLSAFHEEMVTVEQIPFLFSKSIKDNVAFGREEATQEELEAVARDVDIHETILGFPEQYETIVGERGISLSGGQRQRVAMARAFLVNRSILLLDDIFSSLDTATEQRVFEAMMQNFKGKTILLITHRVSVLERMDRVLLMSHGQIVQDGPPSELKKEPGSFQLLVDLGRLRS